LSTLTLLLSQLNNPRQDASRLLVDPVTNTPFSFSNARIHSFADLDDPHNSMDSDAPATPKPLYAFHEKMPERKHPYKKAAKGKMRKPPNAFFLYRLEKQDSVVQKNPNLSTQDISRLLGRMWKNEVPDVVEQYKQRSNELRCKYRELLK